jgi:hypothetical protein
MPEPTLQSIKAHLDRILEDALPLRDAGPDEETRAAARRIVQSADAIAQACGLALSYAERILHDAVDVLRQRRPDAA